jgi:hypothetical protein
MTWPALLLALAACVPSPTAGPTGEVEEAIPYEPSLSASRKADTVATTPALPPAVSDVQTSAAAPGEGEDGRGAIEPSAAALAIDVSGGHLSARADDPSLWIGDLEFKRYRYVGRGTLRFVIADSPSIPSDTPLVLRFGDDESGQEIAASLEAVR